MSGVIAIISGVLWGGKDDTNRFLLTHAAHNHIASHGLPVMNLFYFVGHIVGYLLCHLLALGAG
jgi:hypothetical protein